MNKIRFLGVEGYPQGGRNTISILIENDNHRILLDCGASIINQLDKEQLLSSDIDTVFISHLHADHSSGLILLLYSCLMERFEKRAAGKHTINIIGDEQLLEPLLKYCSVTYPALFNGSGLVDVKVHNVDVCNPHLDYSNNISIDVCPMLHSVDGLSIVLTNDSFKLCYTADTKVNSKLSDIAFNSDILICNIFGSDEKIAESAGFMSAEGAGKLANKIGAHTLFLMHLYDDESRRVAVETAKRYFSGQIIAPLNGDQFNI